MAHEIEPEGQLRLFPLDAPRRGKGQRRMVPTYSDEERAAFRRTEEIIARIRPSSLPRDCKLCAGCGKIIHRDLRSCGRRWCPLVHRTWLRDREAVIRRALQVHGGPFIVSRSLRLTRRAGGTATVLGTQGFRVRAYAAARSRRRSPNGRTTSFLSVVERF